MRLGVTLTLGLGLFAVYSTNTLLSTMLPIISKEFTLTPLLAGLITAAYGWAYAAMQVPVGIIADRHQPRRLIVLSMFIFFLSSLLFGISVSSSLLLLSRLIMGTAASFVYVVGLKTIVLYYEPNERGRSIGLFTSIGLLGISVINLLAPIAIQLLAIDWRAMYLLVSFISLTAVLLTIRFLPKNVHARVESAEPTDRIKVVESISRVSRSRSFWVQNTISFIYFGTLFGLVFWLPSYFDANGLGLTYGGAAVALLGGGSVVGFALVGLFVDRVNRNLVLRGSMTIYTLLMAFVILVPTGRDTAVPILVGSFLLGVAEGGMTANLRIIGEIFDKELVGTAYGIYNAITWIGLAFFPLLIGTLLSLGTNYEQAFSPMLLFMLLALGVSGFSRETRLSKPEPLPSPAGAL